MSNRVRQQQQFTPPGDKRRGQLVAIAAMLFGGRRVEGQRGDVQVVEIARVAPLGHQRLTGRCVRPVAHREADAGERQGEGTGFRLPMRFQVSQPLHHVRQLADVAQRERERCGRDAG